eukprot:gnl/MRDRNA2_/MRDRNA2_77739_c0_seq1.p1 gnl/MRDRNA2_/MRDRNA2_77739_c0~~gnl/MRDRNA2_/MRDRNA2_77739_c0_seq1.p1  ORF type:complete len:171 (+),score=6.84 gnl/MRDRNA2_/MRDRNA2_77739_c0_seq1:105-617(+)
MSIFLGCQTNRCSRRTYLDEQEISRTTLEEKRSSPPLQGVSQNFECDDSDEDAGVLRVDASLSEFLTPRRSTRPRDTVCCMEWRELEPQYDPFLGGCIGMERCCTDRKNDLYSKLPSTRPQVQPSRPISTVASAPSAALHTGHKVGAVWKAGNFTHGKSHRHHSPHGHKK